METRWKNPYSLPFLLVTLSAVLLLVELSSQFSAAAVPASTGNGQFNGSTLGGNEISDEELSVESETRGRILGTRYISPNVLRADSPACGKATRGNPYSITCLPPASNRYHRGCSRIYKCRS